MTKLPRDCSGKECVRALEKIGFVVLRQKGSHIFMERADPPARTVIPNHDSIRVGTLRDILNDAGLTIDEFVKLL